MNALAKRAISYKGSGSYPFVFYGGAEICKSMKGIHGGGILTQAIKKLFNNHFDFCDNKVCLTRCMNQDKGEAHCF
jgi:hypothetical protein